MGIRLQDLLDPGILRKKLELALREKNQLLYATTAGDEIEVRYRLDRSGALADWSTDPTVAGPTAAAAPDAPSVVELVSAAPDRVLLDVAGVRRVFRVHRAGSAVFVDGPDGAAELTELPRFPLPRAALAVGSLLAPLPGTVTRVHVGAGQRVAAGDLLLTLEAMKLEHPVLAPTDGVVADLPVPAGGQVETGAVLAVVNPEEAPR
ncbi:acetyl-CoA carboxylase biotin carboxyl carrier protein subunit, partial [Micromonospora wenchangensis]|uniref:acetyl-CoA carboxylase biotin carboxyl carrier protein subunit n=1 Tax=Micromonospora wenchangensis TaxID=1185415 RepID=UPI0034274027